MKKRKNRGLLVGLLIAFVVIIFMVPLGLLALNGSAFGNIALIPISGPITGNGGKYLGQSTVASTDVISYIEKANENSQVQAIVLEINSPGGSAVASDEIAVAVKKSKKPVISLIREVGASGGYWIASASEQIVANRMSITGSIGVISSYLEFSGLMEEYGVGYERLVAGKNKDIGTPFKKLSETEKKLFQGKLDRIHQYFIEEVATNRDLSVAAVTKAATGEFYLGIEAKNLGLIDQLGDLSTVEKYLKEVHGVTEFDYITYARPVGLLDVLSGALSDFSFSIGEGMASLLTKKDFALMLI